MAHKIAALLVSQTLASVAMAADHSPPEVVCEGQLPFGRQELQAAIRLRLPMMRIELQGDLPAVVVRAVPPRRVSITAGAARRVLSLHGLSREDATRVVALLALDLLSNQRRGPAPRPSPPSAEVASDFVFIGLSPRLSVGAVQWAAAFEPTLDLNIRLSRYLLVFMEVGFTWAGGGEGARKLALLEVPVRAGAAVRIRWFEARAGLALRPYIISAAGEDSGVLVGGVVGLYFRRALSRWLAAYAAVGVDLFPQRKEFRVGSETVLTTSWAVPWLGVGAGWQGG